MRVNFSSWIPGQSRSNGSYGRGGQGALRFRALLIGTTLALGMAPGLGGFSRGLAFADSQPSPPEAPLGAGAEEAPPEATTAEEGQRQAREAILALMSSEPARARFQAMSDEEVSQLMEASDAPSLTKEEQSIRRAVFGAMFERKLTYQTGKVVLGDDLADLSLGTDFRFLPPVDAEKLLTEGWGNPPGAEALGVIVPVDLSPMHEDGWAVIVTYTEDGHVKDDDAQDIDYDDLLEEMKADTLAQNPERKQQGYGEVHLRGWAEPPHYDPVYHRLYWAKDLAFSGATENSLNYAIRFLGRKGVLEFNAVSSLRDLPKVKSEMKKLLPLASFKKGQRYEDFSPEYDKVAAYGIGGLIAGKVLAKVGILGGLFKLLLVFKKLIVVGVVAAVAFIAKLLGRKKTIETPETDER